MGFYFLKFNLAQIENYLEQIENPLKSEKMESLLNLLIDFLQKFSLAIVPILIIFGSYFLVSSGGQREKFESGKKIIFFSLAFFVFVFLLKFIKGLIFSFLEPILR